MNILKVDNVSKTFQTSGRAVTALSDISFSVETGEFVSILGPSGSGKSTLLRLIAGLLEPTEGQITLNGSDDIAHHQSGFVFQDYALFPWRTVRQNLKAAEKFSGKDISDETVDLYLNMVGLNDYADSYPSELSGGMKQRIALIRALIYEPEIILMDEPFAAVDQITKESLYTEFRKILDSTNKTVLYVTHDIEEAYLFSDRLVILSGEGKKINEMELDDDNPRNNEALKSDKFFELRDNVLEMINDDT